MFGQLAKAYFIEYMKSSNKFVKKYYHVICPDIDYMHGSVILVKCTC